MRYAILFLLLNACGGEFRPVVDRASVIALCEPRGKLDGLSGAIAVWSVTGVVFDRGTAGIPVIHDPGMDARFAGEYTWSPQRVRVRLDDSTILAHELGHVLGLDDLPDDEMGVMSKIPLADELTAADLVAFYGTAAE